ncbi:ThuA domain-containing protein [Paenibacillus kobensis]|uniref:ThuA domain-containing protein n=1 Tax=Paenibacillus kobensis TaxID=59841 RepID=UPI000FD8ED7A|nr:ThuA domain-containing protein [Paenibacillus kobensis]
MIPRYRRALIVEGGYEGHKPQEVALIVARMLSQQHFRVDIYNTLDIFSYRTKLEEADLIIPLWTMGELTPDQTRNLTDAVAAGTGLAGLHATADAFRSVIEYQAMVGGQFLAHPGGQQVTYRVHLPHPTHPLVAGIGDFCVTTEQYYMMVDPSIAVLANSCFSTPAPPLVWRPVIMPTAWIKQYGEGRIYYNSLGHSPEIVLMPQVSEMLRRGLVWAARR